MAAPTTTSSAERLARILMLVVLLAVESYESEPMTEAQNGCENVRAAYASKGFNSKEVPYRVVSGEHLQLCPQGFTCCTQHMESNLNTQSQSEFNKVMGDKIALLRNTFISRTAKFDAFFSELLDNAKRDLHNMFVRTYGLLYQQNSHVFTDLFKELRTYYKGGSINLEDALNDFFATLCQKMFVLLNVQYAFDQRYLECVTTHMDELEPFGDVPKKLSIQVQRGFIAARTFVQGLAVGRDVVLEISKLKPSDACGKAVMKMLFCPYCRGMPALKPCNNYCLNVLKGCLAHQSNLNTVWDRYVDALLKLAERLAGPFNIESVVDPIDVKISDAIMNFQENSESVSKKVFSGCGQPKLSRTKRNAASNTQDFSYYYGSKTKAEEPPRPTTAAGTSLDRLVHDIREKVEIVKGFWNNLPHQVCQDLAAPPSQESSCWNGLAMAQYTPAVMKDGAADQARNPEVPVDTHVPNLLVDQQILRLKIITSKLKKAYDGIDVDYMDLETGGDDGSSQMAASGSGSDAVEVASGSGGGPINNWNVGQQNPTRPPARTPPIYHHGDQDRQNNGNNSASTQTAHTLLTILLTVLVVVAVPR